MSRSAAQLRADALAIWHAGLEAVRSDSLVKKNIRVEDDCLLIGQDVAAHDSSVVGTLRVPLSSVDRIAVVGAGKAGAGMAAGLEESLGPRILADKHVTGWINVPADCVRKLQAIHLHAARPAGINEPTEEGVRGTEKILQIIDSLRPNDLCICLLSGGGSALTPAPVPGVSLAEKQTVTRLLSARGANIQELNTVRKHLSQIKGGRLARRCRAGRLITMIISDVLGDPLDVIASGPTVPDSSTSQNALAILERYLADDEQLVPAAFAYLRKGEARRVAVGRGVAVGSGEAGNHGSTACQVTNLIIGNNALAVDAAGIEAERRGYSHAMHAATSLEGPAEEIGVHLAQMALRMQNEPGPDCLITGGEPTVTLAPPEIRGKGGRNQQLVLAALIELLNPKSKIPNPKSIGLALLSAGTDGEDGPTNAAGAFLDRELINRMREKNLDPAEYLRRNDAYHFFEQLGGLIKTGPTHTNVCDLRVAVVDRDF